MAQRRLRMAASLGACIAILASVSSVEAFATEPSPGAGSMSQKSTMGCPADAGSRINHGQRLAQRAQAHWSRYFGHQVGFRIGLLRCGHLVGRSGKEIVAVAFIDGGTGGSPKPWGVYNRTRSGRYRLAHFNSGRKLICPTTLRVRDRRISVHRIARYEGAFSLCSQIVRLRWKRNSYRRVFYRRSWRRCASPKVVNYGSVLYVTHALRASGISCRRAASLIRPWEPWPCEFMPGTSEERCWNQRDRRKWFTYEHGGVLPRPGRYR